MGRKIDGKEISRDIKAGMHKTALMVKYDLTPQQLRATLKKLEDAGLIEPLDLSEPTQIAEFQEKTILRCPKCGTPLPEVNGECPKCGVVAIKYQGADDSSSKAAGSFSLQSTESYFLSNVVSVLVLIAVIIGGYVLYQSYVSHNQYNAAMAEIKPTIVSLSERKKIDWASVSRSLDENLGRWEEVLSQSYPELTVRLKKVAASVFKVRLLTSELQSLERQYARLGNKEDEEGSMVTKGVASDSPSRTGYDPLKSDEKAEERLVLSEKIEATQRKLRDLKGSLVLLCNRLREEM